MTDEPTNEFDAAYSLVPEHARPHAQEAEADVAGAKPPPRRHHGGNVKRTFRRTEERSLARQALRGAVSSLVASTVMGGVLALVKELGLLGEAPPRKLTRKALDTLDFHPRGDDLDAPTAALHVGYGGLIGAISGPLLERLEPRPLRVLGGVATGAAVWAISYAGWIPAIGWMPAPTRDTPPSRPWVMLGAHLVFGAVLGASLPSHTRVHELDLDDDPHVEAIGLG